jgi:hypothetical protein
MFPLLLWIASFQLCALVFHAIGLPHEVYLGCEICALALTFAGLGRVAC